MIDDLRLMTVAKACCLRPLAFGLSYAAVLTVTCRPARVARVMSISRLNFSHFPLTRSETRD